MFTIYSADVTGNPGNCSYPHKHVILDEDSLKAAICHDYVCAEYKNSYRNGDNFIGSNCLPVDCDNDHSENPDDWVTPDDIMQLFRVSVLLSTIAATTIVRKMGKQQDRSSMCCFQSSIYRTPPSTAI